MKFFCGLLCLLIGTLDVLASDRLSQQEIEQILTPAAYANAYRNGTQTFRGLLEKLDTADEDAALWPMLTFLKAETLRAADMLAEAAPLYHRIIETAATDRQRDTWGDNAFVAFALYRWLDVSKRLETSSAEEMAGLFDAVDTLLRRRLARAVFETHPILPRLPLFEEELFLALAKEAQRSGLDGKAASYFLKYLSRLRQDRPADETSGLYELVIAKGLATEDRIALARGRRLAQLGDKQSARPLLEKAAASGDEQVGLEAKYLLARHLRFPRNSDARSAVYKEIARYASKDSLIALAMFQEALLHAPDEAAYRESLHELVNAFPDGAFVDDALYWLARGEHMVGRLDAALPWYAKLMQVSQSETYQARAVMFPAIGLILRSEGGDLDRAADLLAMFTRDNPESRYRPDALFWYGRIMEAQQHAQKAKSAFEEVAKHDPFGYYGLRARMHLADGPSAKMQRMPQNASLRRELKDAYAKHVPARSLNESANRYIQRVEGAVSLGIYRYALAGEDQLRAVQPSKRIEDFTANELDAEGLLTRIAVLIAIREDALAAVDTTDDPHASLALSERVAKEVADWPLAMTLVHSVSRSSHGRLSTLMEKDGYLRAAYPKVYPRALLDYASRYRVMPEILYAVMRNESFFYPAAMSPAGALGLFQFIESTFNAADAEWQLLANSGHRDRRAYLLDADESLALGARWFGEKKLRDFGNDILLAALAHHSGDHRVRPWIDRWTRLGCFGDVELMIETFRLPEIDRGEMESWGLEARDFARRIMRDVAITDAIDLYDGVHGND